MRRTGFTLVETLIAVVLVALIASLVVTATGTHGAQALESVARVVAADLRLARHQAVYHNSQWTVAFDVENNRYELLHSGAGTPPPLRNPLEPDRERYVVELSRLGTGDGLAGDNGIRLAAIWLENSQEAVVDVTFGPLGGTGPRRTEHTVLLLTEGWGDRRRAVTLTVSWVTGQVFISEPTPLKEQTPQVAESEMLQAIESVSSP